jgi:23S rRNA (cytosine1962-C5)-methyltransferase
MQRQADMFGNRVRKTFQRLRKTMARAQIEAFRLYDRDIPELRLVVDWYAGHAVLGEYVRDQTDVPEFLPAMADALAKALEIPLANVHVKQRRTGARGHRYERLERKGERLPVREGDLTYLCNLDDFIDTGLYADHRQTRQMLRAEANGTDFLNLYAYTGAFTVAAAKGGAKSTMTVDASQQYLDWARDNLVQNHLDGPQHTFAAIDVQQWLDWAARAGPGSPHPLRFDLAWVDPPSFSANRQQGREFDVQRDHHALLTAVIAVMRPGGVVYFSTNHQRFVADLDDLGVTVADISAQTLPGDYRNEQVHRCWRLQLP